MGISKFSDPEYEKEENQEVYVSVLTNKRKTKIKIIHFPFHSSIKSTYMYMFTPMGVHIKFVFQEVLNE